MKKIALTIVMLCCFCTVTFAGNISPNPQVVGFWDAVNFWDAQIIQEQKKEYSNAYSLFIQLNFMSNQVFLVTIFIEYPKDSFFWELKSLGD
ncbi:hypothetical protein LCGC14_1188570 [marine sediment metagenome]|uniref:Uncharacterized protein n=1 Tax=marine sediment metagenome TaxID=412755 RepID=A0A0F9LPY5_9ZZZZ